MRLAQAALPLLLVALMAAPPWLDAAAQQAPGLPPAPAPAVPQAPVPVPREADPLTRLLGDLQAFLGRAEDAAGQAAPPGPNGVPSPDPRALSTIANRTTGDAQDDVANATQGSIRTLLYEGFEGGTLGDLGWGQEVVSGDAPWGIVDGVERKVLRDGGASFTPEFETGQSPIVVKDGQRAATILNPQGRYDGRVDARLISPVVDLRYVLGASTRSDEMYDKLTTDPTLGEPYRQFLAFWRATLAPVKPVPVVPSPGEMLSWILTTPPSQIQRIHLAGATPTCTVPDVFSIRCRGYFFDNFFVNPVQPRYGGGLVNLTFYHKYDFADDLAGDYDRNFTVRTDGAFLEARIVHADGTVGPWEQLFGDPVFEPYVNRGGMQVPFFVPDPDNPLSVRPQFIPVSQLRVPASGTAESVQGGLTGQSDYNFFLSNYNGRIQLRPYNQCYGVGTKRVDCQPDAPAWVRDAQGIWKSHFTLNAYAGQQIQLAWRVHSGTAGIQPEETGWFLDAVKVEALLPMRDPGIDRVVRPRPGDVVPTTALLQPQAVVKNYGYLPVEGIRVNFTIEEALPALTPEAAQQAAASDAAQVGRTVGDVEAPGVPGVPPGQVQPPGVPQAEPPTATVGAVQAATRPGRVLLRASATIDRLDPLASVVATSPLACTACVPGQYRLLVQVSTQGAGGGEAGSLPASRTDDGTGANNNLTVPFEVRDAPGATLRLSVPAASVLTDISEPKTLRIELRNTGNLDLTGIVEVGAIRVDPTTKAPLPGEGRSLAGSLFVGPGDLPATSRLTSFGSADDAFEGSITWNPAGLAPGVYLLDAAFKAAPVPLVPVGDTVFAFIRATPTAYYPSDGRPREDFEGLRDPVDGFGKELPRAAGFSNRGFTTVQGTTPGCPVVSQDACVVGLPRGSVSRDRHWIATASDGPLLELSALGALAGHEAGAQVSNPPAVVPRPTPPFPAGSAPLQVAGNTSYAAVKFQDNRAQLCVKVASALAENCTLGADALRHDGPDRTIASVAATRYKDHAYLNDYYLSRVVDLSACADPCKPVLSFWTRGTLNWAAVANESVSYPGALGSGPLAAPGAAQQVSPNQAFENRSRALVEVVPVDGGGAAVRHDVLPGGVPLGAQPSVCGPVGLVKEANPCAPVRDTCTSAGTAGLPALAAPDPALGEAERLYNDRVRRGEACAGKVAGEPFLDAAVVKEFREPIPEWTRVEVDLSAWAGRKVALAFHFQTALGHLNQNGTTATCFPQGSSGASAIACLGHHLDAWHVDNVRVAARSGASAAPFPGGFFDTVGDIVPLAGHDVEEWKRWASFRILRDAADANVLLHPECFAPLRTRLGTGTPEAPSTQCLADSRLRGPAVSVDGRGWDVFDHAAGRVQANGVPSPYHDGWFVDESAGFQPPGRQDPDGARALRWGGPGNGATYGNRSSYNVLSGPLMDLSESSQPFAEFQANWTFSRADKARVPNEFKDGAVMTLARYVQDPACDTPAVPDACWVLDRRALVVPEGASGMVHNDLLDRAPFNDVNLTRTNARFINIPNGFAGRSGTNPEVSEWVQVRVDLAQAIERMCLKQVTDSFGSAIRSYRDTAECRRFRTDANLTWLNGETFDRTTGETLRNITSFDQDRDARYRLEFHTMNYEDLTSFTTAYGIAVDDLRVGERVLANDIGISRIVFPKPGQLVGPDEKIQVRVNITNHGLFTQRGVRVSFNVTQQGAQVFPHPTNASQNPAGCDLRNATGAIVGCTQITPLGLAIPGLRDPNPQRNVSVAFEVEWVPQGQGVFTINAWSDIVGELVGGALVPLADENVVNDLFAQEVEVRKVHSVRLLPSGEFPDASSVVPLVGTVQDRRELWFVLENIGTVSEGQSTFEGLDTNGDGAVDKRVPRWLNVTARVTDENGRLVPNQPDPKAIDLLAPGRQFREKFVWDPPAGGLFTITFRAETAVIEGQPLDPGLADNERVVRVLVLTQLIPRPGEPWTGLFRPEGTGWANASRFRFDAGAGWSFGLGDTYGPLQSGSIVLTAPQDLTSFRNAVLAVRHAYDLEEGYDGGVVEVSADGKTWQAVAPATTVDADGRLVGAGYPATLTTASPEVPRPGDLREAFTGRSEGVVTSVFPLGTVDLTRSEPVVILRDTFDPGAVVAGADLAEARGRWVEVRSTSTPPTGKAWWTDKNLTFPADPLVLEAPTSGANTLEGRKELVARIVEPDDGDAATPRRLLTFPAIEAPLVVEFDEWRALGLSRRGATTLQTGYVNPTGPEVVLERVQELPTGQKVELTLPVQPRASDAFDPYDDNYLDWTRRSFVVPSTQARALAGGQAQLVFRLYLANSNNEAAGPGLLSNYDEQGGSGAPEDSDVISPNLGWAVAAPRLYYVTSLATCQAAGLPYRDGRCMVFEDRLAYADGDEARAGEVWRGRWQAELYKSGQDLPTVLRSGPATADLLPSTGWRIVDAVGVVTDKAVWDTQALAPARSGKGRVAEATGSGADARLVTPLNLRSAAGEVLLSFDHSFKFTDLRAIEQTPPMTLRGAVSGGRVEVSRDGGRTWEPVAPVVRARELAPGEVDRLSYTRALDAEGFLPVFARGNPLEQQQCGRPSHPGCVGPDDPFRAPGGWLADGQPHDWEPSEALSAHTPFSDALHDPERNSPFGIGSRAFSGHTCTLPTVPPSDVPPICDEPTDWRRATFDLSKYAGQDVLLAFHAFFTTHRLARVEHVGCIESDGICEGPANEVLVPRDFWRIDNVSVEARVLDGKPLHIRLRGFSDANGEAYGWDVLNVSLLGDRHLRNLGVRILDPLAGAPLFGSEQAVDARVVNRGQERLTARATVLVEQNGTATVRNGGFEEPLPQVAQNWTIAESAPGNVALSATAAEGRRALRLTGPAGNAATDPFRLEQAVRVPAGHWRLVGHARVAPLVENGPILGAAGVQLGDAAGDDGKPDPTRAFAADNAWRRFEVNFTIDGGERDVRLRLLARPNALGAGAPFQGVAYVDHLRIEPRAPPGAVPAMGAFANPSFEDGLDGWQVLRGQGRSAGLVDKYRISFPPTHQKTLPAMENASQPLAGSAPVSFDFWVADVNLTQVSLDFVIEGVARAADEFVNITIRSPEGALFYRNDTVAAGGTVVLPATGLRVPSTTQGQSTSVDDAVAAALPPSVRPTRNTTLPAVLPPPGNLTVEAPSADQALRNGTIPPARNLGIGLWNVTFRFEPKNLTQPVPAPAAGAVVGGQVGVPRSVNATLPAEVHVESHRVRITPKLAFYDKAATPVETPTGLGLVPDGARSLVVGSPGAGKDDFHVAQTVALEPGKYRLTGFLGSRDANIAIGTDRDRDPAQYETLQGSRQLTQELNASHLPRYVTKVLLWFNRASDATAGEVDVEVSAGGDHERLLARLERVKPNRTGTVTEVNFDGGFYVPAGVDKVQLKVKADSGLTYGVEVVPGDPYPGGALRNASADLDLRAVFHGPIDPAGGLARLVVAGGNATWNEGHGWTLGVPVSVEHAYRQVVALNGSGARRIVSVAVNVSFPEVPSIATGRTDGTPAHYALRQGQVFAQLFDEAGRPISEEAVYHERAVETNTVGFTMARWTRDLDFTFSNAVVPEGAARIQVGFRVANMTGVRFLAVPDSGSLDPASPEGHQANGYLAYRGAPALFLPGASRCTTRSDDRTVEGLQGCDLALNITYRREGVVTIGAPGVQGEPVVLVQPTPDAAILSASQKGYVPFQFDFTVPAGLPAVTLRVRGDHWQGDAVLDGLALQPLTQPAAAFQGSVAGGEEAPIRLANGAAPRITAVKGATYRVVTEALAVDGAGQPVRELLVGDNRATLVTGPALGPGRVVIAELEGDPNSVNLTTGERTFLRLTLRNEGAQDAELLGAEGRVVTRGGQVLAEFTQADFDPVPDSLTLGPLEERTFRWPWSPDPALAHGVYEVQASVSTQPTGRFTPADDAAASLLYVGTDFHRQFAFEWPFFNSTEEDAFLEEPDDAEGRFETGLWTSTADWNPAYPPANECDPLPDAPPANNPCTQAAPCDGSPGDLWGLNPNENGDCTFVWRRTSEVNNSAFRSITLGGDVRYPLGFTNCCQGQGIAAGTIFATVRSPRIPIADMQRPQLLYADRHDFNGVEAEGSIYARLVDARSPVTNDWRFFPEGPCLDRDRAHGWVQVDDHITGLSPGFRSGKWVMRSIDLGPLMDRARAETGDLAQWTDVQVCWHLEQPSPRTGASLIKEWSIDDVLITPYGMALTPGQRIPITDNVSKDFRLLLTNRGAYTDTYEVRLEEETGLASKGPSNWKVSLHDEDGAPLDDVKVRPGESRVVVARVRVDVAPPTLARDGSVDLAVTAISKTTSLLRSTQHLLFDFHYEDRPNLRVAGLIVNDAILSVDKPRTVDVLVQNTGTVTARGATLAVVDKMDPSFGVAPEELLRLDGTRLEPFDIAPGDTKVFTVNWVPRVEGEHNVTAIADPGGRILEFDERDNTLVKPILIPRAEFPDLLVEATASTRNPSPGDLVEVSARITNKGGAPATGVQVSVRAGVTDLLPGEPPHVLPKAIGPGETVVLNASWRPAFPGEQAIIVRAKTFAGVLERLETSGDNVQILVINVRSRGLDVAVPSDVTVAPGGLVNATIEVRNRGDVDDAYLLTLEPPEEWRGLFVGLGEATKLVVGNHSARNLTLQLGPPRHAEAGPYQVRILARSENGSEALEVHLVASVPQSYGIRFTLEPEHLLLPGKRYLPLTLRNGGNGLDFVTVRARDIPAGWTVEPTTFAVGPKAMASVRVNLTSPTTTPEAAYRIVLEAQGRGGDLLAQEAKVLIQPYELLQLAVRDVPEVLVPGTAVEGSLVVRNAGNVPARADLSLRAPPEWRVRLERDVVGTETGESRTLRLGLTVPANATAKQQALLGTATSGRDATYGLAAPVRAARTDLAILALDQLPRGQVREGATVTVVATVANQGETPLQAPLASYVDDLLMGFDDGPLLQPGEQAKVNLTFKAKGGEHVVLVAVDPGQVVGEEDETDNARLLVLRADRAAGLFAVPGPEPWLLALAAASIAIILRKRREVDR